MALRSRALMIIAAAALLLAGCSLEPPRTSSHAPAAQQRSQQRAVTIAEEMVGKPYRYGGSTPQGFDCSGLVYYSYSKAGYTIPRDSDGQYAQALPIDPRKLRRGDLLFFNIDGKNDHVGIYVGNNRFIHAPSRGKRVSYASLGEEYWRNRLLRAGRLR